MKQLIPTLKYLSFLVIFTLLAAEVLLRLFNPIPFRVKGDKIILPSNQKVIINNDRIPRLDSVIYHTKNQMGFRGPDVPKNLDEYLSIVAVGGSTTECYYISDTLTWPHQLGVKLAAQIPNIWMNNAGLDGHSTFGHQILLTDYILDLKPDYILFMVGCNDVERDDLNQMDQMKEGLSVRVQRNNFLAEFLKNHSEVASLIDNLIRASRARHRNLVHHDLAPKLKSHDTLSLESQTFNEILNKQAPYVAGFRHRVSELVELCKVNDIQPVLLTQASLLGVGNDPVTGGDLEKIRLDDHTNGKLYWQRLELYNQEVREVASTNDILLIDLAKLIPKSSRYFYDTVHFTNEGSSYVAEVIYHKFVNYLDSNNIVIY